MSFGYHDSDWVNPPDEVVGKCEDCSEFIECPCGCGVGYCRRHNEFFNAKEECTDEWFRGSAR